MAHFFVNETMRMGYHNHSNCACFCVCPSSSTLALHNLMMRLHNASLALAPGSSTLGGTTGTVFLLLPRSISSSHTACLVVSSHRHTAAHCTAWIGMDGSALESGLLHATADGWNQTGTRLIVPISLTATSWVLIWTWTGHLVCVVS